MVINLSNKVLKIARDSLIGDINGVKYKLEYAIPNKRANPDMKGRYEEALKELEGALQELEDAMRVSEELSNAEQEARQ